MAGRTVEVLGSAGTIELSAANPARSQSPSLSAALIRAVKREPRDVCFGIYASNESPQDGDIGCHVRDHGPLVSSIGEAAIPGGARPLLTTYVPGGARALLTTYVLGQASSDRAMLGACS